MTTRAVASFLVALVATLAVVGAIRWLDGNDDPPEPVTATHVFDADYAGPVWVTISDAGNETQTVLLTWGLWQRRFQHKGDEPVTYVFTKGGLDREAPSPVTAILPRGGSVTFGQGLIPPDPAVSIREGWLPAGSGEPSTTAP